MMIVAMYNVWIVLPFGEPVAKGNLESKKPFRIVFIAINLFAVEQTVNINQEKIEAKYEDGVLKISLPRKLDTKKFTAKHIAVK